MGRVKILFLEFINWLVKLFVFPRQKKKLKKRVSNVLKMQNLQDILNGASSNDPFEEIIKLNSVVCCVCVFVICFHPKGF